LNNIARTYGSFAFYFYFVSGVIVVFSGFGDAGMIFVYGIIRFYLGIVLAFIRISNTYGSFNFTNEF